MLKNFAAIGVSAAIAFAPLAAIAQTDQAAPGAAPAASEAKPMAKPMKAKPHHHPMKAKPMAAPAAPAEAPKS